MFPLEEGEPKDRIWKSVFFQGEKVLKKTSIRHDYKVDTGFKMIPKDALAKHLMYHPSSSAEYSCAVALNGTKRGGGLEDRKFSSVLAVSAPYSLVIKEEPGVYASQRKSIQYLSIVHLKCMYTEPYTQVKWEEVYYSPMRTIVKDLGFGTNISFPFYVTSYAMFVGCSVKTTSNEWLPSYEIQLTPQKPVIDSKNMIPTLNENKILLDADKEITLDCTYPSQNLSKTFFWETDGFDVTPYITRQIDYRASSINFTFKRDQFLSSIRFTCNVIFLPPSGFTSGLTPSRASQDAVFLKAIVVKANWTPSAPLELAIKDAFMTSFKPDHNVTLPIKCFGANVPSEHAGLEYSWWKDGDYLHYQQEVLYPSAVHGAMAGMYKCRIKHHYYEIISREVRVLDSG